MQMKCPRGPHWVFQARSSIYEGSQNRKLCRYSITAAVAVTRSVSAIPLEKIAEILCFGVRGGTQQRFDVKDFLQRFQSGAVVVVGGIGKDPFTAALGNRREDEPANRAIAEFAAVFGLIPDDEQCAAFLVLVRLSNQGHILFEPSIGAQRIIGRFRGSTRRNSFMAVVAEVWRNEVIPGRGVVGQIGRQLVIGFNVRDAFSRLRVQPIVDVVKVDKGKMFHIEECEIQRAVVEDGTAKVWLRIGPPGNAGIFKKFY